MAEFGAQATAETLQLGLGDIADECKRIVVGMDFGTAYSGVAYAYKVTPNQMKMGAPSARDETQMKVPTAILIKGNGGYEFGYTAEEKYNEGLQALQDGETLSDHLYKGFKMELKDKHSGFDSLTALSVAGKPHSLLDLVVKCLISLKDHALRNLTSGFGADVKPEEDVQWVLTVPAIWNEFGKAFMRKAAFQAGLIGTEHSDNLMLVLEPEGAALAVHIAAYEHGLLGVGSRFMVLDCGGGTVDITTYDVFKVSPLELKAISAPAGGAWGGEYVNKEFDKFLEEFLGPKLYTVGQIPYEFYSVNSEFEKVKMLFDPSKDPVNCVRMVDVLENKPQLVELAEAWNAKHPSKPVLVNSTLRNGFLTTSRALMMSFFEPLLKAMVDETKRVLRETPGIRHIIVVGGFGSSRVLVDRVNEEFHMKGGVRVLLAPRPQAAIAIGAVYFGLYKNLIDSRLSPYTYGIAMRMNGVNNSFKVLVHRGQELPENHVVEEIGNPASASQTALSWRIFRSELTEPETVMGQHHLGTVTAQCPPHPDESRRTQRGRFMFGGPEIKVSVVNAANEEFKKEIKNK